MLPFAKLGLCVQDVFLAKTDVKNAFRIIPVRAHDYTLTGMRWQGVYYYDQCMPMGCSSRCKTFKTFSTVLEWFAHSKLKISHIIQLHDIFLIIAPSQALWQNQLNLFLDLCSYLGIPWYQNKKLVAQLLLSFASIELDSISLEAQWRLDSSHSGAKIPPASFYGRSFFLDNTWSNSDKLNLFTDAARALGFGDIFWE